MPTLRSAIDASASALDAQRARMEVAVSNLANAESTIEANGQPYRRRQVVLETKPFASELMARQGGAVGVRVAAIVEDQGAGAFQRRLEPSHPEADAEGFVLVPDISVPDEMVDMLGAARAYQANLTAITLIRDTIQRALELAK